MPTVMRFWIITALLLVTGVSLAQADSAAGRLEQAVGTARESGQLRHPDQPLWREAIRLGEELLAAEPGSVGLARLQAEIYSEVAWYARAFDAWLHFSDVSGAAPEPAPFAEAAHQLGYARYSFGDAAGALGYYERLLEFQ